MVTKLSTSLLFLSAVTASLLVIGTPSRGPLLQTPRTKLQDGQSSRTKPQDTGSDALSSDTLVPPGAQEGLLNSEGKVTAGELTLEAENETPPTTTTYPPPMLTSLTFSVQQTTQLEQDRPLILKQATVHNRNSNVERSVQVVVQREEGNSISFSNKGEGFGGQVIANRVTLSTGELRFRDQDGVVRQFRYSSTIQGVWADQVDQPIVKEFGFTLKVPAWSSYRFTAYCRQRMVQIPYQGTLLAQNKEWVFSGVWKGILVGDIEWTTEKMEATLALNSDMTKADSMGFPGNVEIEEEENSTGSLKIKGAKEAQTWSESSLGDYETSSGFPCIDCLVSKVKTAIFGADNFMGQQSSDIAAASVTSSDVIIRPSSALTVPADKESESIPDQLGQGFTLNSNEPIHNANIAALPGQRDVYARVFKSDI